MLDLNVIPIRQSSLRWRLADHPHRDRLRPQHLRKIEPLDHESAGRLLDLTRPWLREQPFTPGWFTEVASLQIGIRDDPEQTRRVRKWLYQRGIPFGHRVYLSWSSTEGAITTWKMVVKYWDELWHPIADDLAVFDGSLSWALFLWHEGEAFFARRPVAQAQSFTGKPRRRT